MGVATWAGPPPAEITAWSLVRAGHLAGRRFHAALGDLGLTPTQFGVLLQLDLHPGLANGQIARAVLVTPQTMSDLMGSLEQLGLIARSPSRGRGHPIPARLTSAGRAALGRCAEVIAGVERSLGLTAEQAATLNGLLRAITDGPPGGMVPPP